MLITLSFKKSLIVEQFQGNYLKSATFIAHFGFVGLRKTRSRKSRDYRDVIVFGKLRFQNCFPPLRDAKPAFSNSSGLKSVFKKLRFRDGLVCVR